MDLQSQKEFGLSQDPFADIEQAFNPFYQECVVLEKKDKSIRQTIFCNVFTDNTDEDVISDQNIDTTREVMTFLCLPKDWGFIQKITRGDIVERPKYNKKYAVQTVLNDGVMGIVIKAREK